MTTATRVRCATSSKGTSPALTLATMQFKRAVKEDLLCGLVETIYAMRNALGFTAWYSPHAKVLMPAMNQLSGSLMQFLNCIR